MELAAEEKGVSCIDHMTKSIRMNEGQSHMTERILNLTLEIIYLLTGEDYKVVRKISGEPLTPNNCLHRTSPITVSPPPCLTTEVTSAKKILEVTKKMMGLLTGEVPIRCQDVTVYFSMEEWEYLEGHKDLYKDVMMDNQPAFSDLITGKKIFHLPKRILNLVLEILELLIGQDCIIEKRPSAEQNGTRRDHCLTPKLSNSLILITEPSTLMPEIQNEQNILDLTKKMMELLAGEVPIRCQDVTVYFSMEEWEYLEGHKDLYKDVMMDNQPPLTSPGKRRLYCKGESSTEAPPRSPII
ncbi:uncharacterized protein LOC143955860 [Lithobates pipiens]